MLALNRTLAGSEEIGLRNPQAPNIASGAFAVKDTVDQASFAGGSATSPSLLHHWSSSRLSSANGRMPFSKNRHFTCLHLLPAPGQAFFSTPGRVVKLPTIASIGPIAAADHTPILRHSIMHTSKRITALLLATVALLQTVCVFAQEAASSTTADSKSLFNGKDLSGWHADVPELDKNPDAQKPFIVRDGLLVSLGKPGGHLITDDKFQDYRLTVEYRFADDPGNCGVLVHASKQRALYGMFPQSIEVQMAHENAGDFWCIVEDITVPDMERRRGPKENWGITEGKGRRILNLTDDSENPPGEWNTMVIECLDDKVKVWVNGDLVNEGHNCTAQDGHIALQAEGSEVEFRKLELTPIMTLSDNL